MGERKSELEQGRRDEEERNPLTRERDVAVKRAKTAEATIKRLQEYISWPCDPDNSRCHLEACAVTRHMAESMLIDDEDWYADNWPDCTCGLASMEKEMDALLAEKAR